MTAERPDAALLAVRDALRALVDDPDTPRAVREALADEYAAVAELLQKLEHGELHIAVFGRVSVGKSSLLNALLDDAAFATGALHGVTRDATAAEWTRLGDSAVHVFDTPGIDEIDGEAREALARHVAARSDVVLFVCEADLTRLERDAIASLATAHRPMLLVLNKADHYTDEERDALLARIRETLANQMPAERVLAVSADPRPRTVIRVADDGTETETTQPRTPDVANLRAAIGELLHRDGPALAALNAGLFASEVSDAVAQRIADIRADGAARVIRGYCLAKGAAVAINPVPLTDLIAAAALDVSLVVHLGRIYGLPITRHEAGRLVGVISLQLAALMGTVWLIHTVSSLLKTVSVGLSVTVTALAQGSIAWYATYLIGQIATRYFVGGKSWGPGGPKRAVRAVLDSVDRDSVLADARQALAERLRR